MKLSFKKLSFWDAAIIAAVLALCGVLWTQNSKNPIEVALLRWYQANTATTFTTCAVPTVLAFDGKHMWVTCGSSGELQEYDASNGTLVATVTSVFNSGVFFDSLLYDGKNIWVAGNNGPSGQSIIRISVSTVNMTPACSMAGGCGCVAALGAGCAAVNNVGSGATGLTFDGNNVWVANSRANNLSYTLANATNPAATTVTLATACTQPLFLAFDGTNVWVPCRGSNSVQLVNSVTPSQQTVINGITAPSGLTYDGNNMWVSAGSNLYEISPSPGGTYAVSSAYAVPQGGGGGTAYDGKYLWVADYSTAMVTKFLVGGPATSGTPPNFKLLGPYLSGPNPESPSFDGGNMWVASSGGSSVSKF